MKKMNKKLKAIREDLESSWLGTFSFEAVQHFHPEDMDEYYNCDINNKLIRRSVIEKIAITDFNSLNDISKEDYKSVLFDALTFGKEELSFIFDSSDLVFRMPIQDPHAFLVDLKETVFPEKKSRGQPT